MFLKRKLTKVDVYIYFKSVVVFCLVKLTSSNEYVVGRTTQVIIVDSVCTAVGMFDLFFVDSICKRLRWNNCNQGSIITPGFENSAQLLGMKLGVTQTLFRELSEKC